MKRWPFVLLVMVLATLMACGEEEPGRLALTQESTSKAGQPTAEEGQATIEVREESPRTAIAEPPLRSPTPDADEALYETSRESMVLTGIIGWGVEDKVVIDAMRAVPRHEFVPEEYRDQAYANHPLPIGFGQTISQPYIVAKMTEAIEVSPGDKVLEIGTGSGYQAAVLAEIVDQVYSVEIIGDLLERARSTHERVGYDNISTLHADGYLGWEEHAPYDAIIVTAAPDHVPIPLVQQLKLGGRMIIPVGPVGGFQRLWLLTRISEDEVQTHDLGGVSFVPLTRETR